MNEAMYAYYHVSGDRLIYDPRQAVHADSVVYSLWIPGLGKVKRSHTLLLTVDVGLRGALPAYYSATIKNPM